MHDIFLPVSENPDGDVAEDSEIMEQITKDIQYKDLPHLRQDFQRLEEKYRALKYPGDRKTIAESVSAPRSFSL